MRLFAGIAIAAAAATLYGCPNPNDIGVQTYGQVAVTVINASNNQPVTGALVSAGSTITCTTTSNGTCPSPLTVPVGKWTINAAVAGLTGSAEVTVTANQTSTVTIQVQ